MSPDEGLRPHVDRLARLLADERGAAILAELQKLALRSRRDGPWPTAEPTLGTRAADEPELGVWRVERTPAGAALRRTGRPASELAAWADVDYVPPAEAARRVVLLGESAARGWPFDPLLNCAGVLGRHLDEAGGDRYQCVDLAKTGATADDLVSLADRLGLIEPDVVVAFAGNNWVLQPEDLEFGTSQSDAIEVRDALADALRSGGYAAMRKVFLSTVALAVAHRFLDSLAALQERHGSAIVIVVPEFNLCGWTPPADIETPVLPPGALAAWYDLRAAADAAARERRWSAIAAIAAEMAKLDGGTSPVPGHLRGRAAQALGDGASARAAFEDSRDAVCGLLVRYTPRITCSLQALLVSYAEARGWRCVDLRAVLASPDQPELPDPRLFHDYCHLSDLGIERAMAAVADAVLGRAEATTVPGPGVAAPQRAFGHAHAAAHLAFQGQPTATVLHHLRAAADTDAQFVPVLAAVLDLLSAPRPVWTHPAAQRLLAVPALVPFLTALAQSRGLSPELWTLRESLGDLTGSETTGDVTADMDLLAVPNGAGHPLPNWTPPRTYHQGTARQSAFAFALDRPRAVTVALTYRTPSAVSAETADLLVNGAPVTALPASTRWMQATVPVSEDMTRAGVNRLDIRWPVPAPDVHARHVADAAALARGEYPYVLPVFGEVFQARVRLAGTVQSTTSSYSPSP